MSSNGCLTHSPPKLNETKRWYYSFPVISHHHYVTIPSHTFISIMIQVQRTGVEFYLECHAKIILMVDRFICHLFQVVPYVESS
jgi:hypothetical protein